MDRSSTDFETRLFYAGMTFGGLLLIAPLIGAAIATWLIPHSLIATLMGLIMFPGSMIAAMFIWQGFDLLYLLRDAVRVTLLHRIDGLRGGYYDGTPFSRAGRRWLTPSGAALIPTPVVVCAVSGFLASIISHLPIALGVAIFATMGLVYGIALYGALWLVVLPLLVEARRL